MTPEINNLEIGKSVFLLLLCFLCMLCTSLYSALETNCIKALYK